LATGTTLDFIQPAAPTTCSDKTGTLTQNKTTVVSGSLGTALSPKFQLYKLPLGQKSAVASSISSCRASIEIIIPLVSSFMLIGSNVSHFVHLLLICYDTIQYLMSGTNTSSNCPSLTLVNKIYSLPSPSLVVASLQNLTRRTLAFSNSRQNITRDISGCPIQFYHFHILISTSSLQTSREDHCILSVRIPTFSNAWTREQVDIWTAKSVPRSWEKKLMSKILSCNKCLLYSLLWCKSCRKAIINEAAANRIVTVLKKMLCALDSFEFGGMLICLMVVLFVSLDRAGMAWVNSVLELGNELQYGKWVT